MGFVLISYWSPIGPYGWNVAINSKHISVRAILSVRVRMLYLATPTLENIQLTLWHERQLLAPVWRDIHSYHLQKNYQHMDGKDVTWFADVPMSIHGKRIIIIVMLWLNAQVLSSYPFAYGRLLIDQRHPGHVALKTWLESCFPQATSFFFFFSFLFSLLSFLISPHTSSITAT